MKIQRWARAVIFMNALGGLLGGYFGIAVMRAARGGLNVAGGGRDEFAAGMFAGGLGLILLLMGLTSFSLAAAGFFIMKQRLSPQAPGPFIKAFLVFATVVPVILICAAGAYWFLK